ncbi:hypothetical protein CC86DRAFT_21401 [Ophiobolus disseminans]|uniref:Uncharacterized protein n=1 Tax=Ophiobolus disseminans TaxID=1469910 RepID=A0A6A7A269_9PLEO|nr:hypothetical protein CC86DRAFT_21401 [Ophiobolus disseminans]
MKKFFERIEVADGSIHEYEAQYDEEFDGARDMNSENGDNDYDEKGNGHENDQKTPCLLLDNIPAEVRLTIYTFVLINEKEACKERRRAVDQPERKYKVYVPSTRINNRRVVGCSESYTRYWPQPPPRKPSKLPTVEQRELENAWGFLLDRQSMRRIARAKQCNELTQAAEEAFLQYKLQHETYARRCWHELDYKKGKYVDDSDDGYDSD